MPHFQINYVHRTRKSLEKKAIPISKPYKTYMRLHAANAQEAEAYFREEFMGYEGSQNSLISVIQIGEDK